jgi:hypothetical protein
MIRCNGSFSGGRAIPAKRIQDGKTDPSAQLERACCGVSVSIVVKSMTTLSPNYELFLNYITGSCLDEHCKTWTFTRRLSIAAS